MENEVWVYAGIVLLILMSICMYLISRISDKLHNARVDMDIKMMRNYHRRINNLLGLCCLLLIVYIGLLLIL